MRQAGCPRGTPPHKNFCLSGKLQRSPRRHSGAKKYVKHRTNPTLHLRAKQRVKHRTRAKKAPAPGPRKPASPRPRVPASPRSGARSAPLFLLKQRVNQEAHQRQQRAHAVG